MYHGGDREVLGVHLLSQPVDLPAGIAEDYSLGDGERLVDVAEGLELPIFPLDGHVELTDTVQGQFLLLDEDPDRFPHEAFGHLQHLAGHGGRQQHHLDVLVQLLEDIVDLVLEPPAQHFVGLVQDEHLDVPSAEHLPADHVVDTTRCSCKAHKNGKNAASTIFIDFGGFFFVHDEVR